jgi:hypothetical protein
MSVRIVDNTAKIVLATQRQASLAVRFMLDDVHSLSEPKTPKDTGQLRRNVRKSVIGLTGKIIWGAQYASILENKQFSNYTTAGTGPNYARNAVTSVSKSPANAMRKARLI